MKKYYAFGVFLLIVSVGMIFTSSASKFSLFSNNVQAKVAIKAPVTDSELNSGKDIGKNDTGDLTFYNTNVSVITQPEGGKVVINKGVDWYANIDPKLTDAFANGDGLTSEDAVFDPRDSSEIDPILLKFLDYINVANSYLYQNPNATDAEVQAVYDKVWGFAWKNNYAVQAQGTDQKGLSPDKPQPTKALTVYEPKEKKYFCFIDSRYLGNKVNDPNVIDQVMIMESCGKFFKIKGFKE